MGLPFRMDLVEWCAEHRHPLLTPFFQFFTFLGEIQGFILIIALVYVAYDKRLATRLAVLTLLTMSLNHILKTLVHNPRPFMGDGSYRTKWLVSEARAADLATEFSTPSGHAMAGGAFYAYAYGATAHRIVRVLCVICLLMIGVSRPYLGVHYVEDVLSGWLLGVLIALLALRSSVRIGKLWDGLALPRQLGLLIAGSAVLWLGTWMLSDWSSGDPPSAFISYAGLLTGIVIGHDLEQRFVDFDPKGGGTARTLFRYLLCVGLVLGTLEALDVAFDALAPDASPSGQALRYARYTAAGLAGIFGAPLLFVRLGLASAARDLTQPLR